MIEPHLFIFAFQNDIYIYTHNTAPPAVVKSATDTALAVILCS